MLLRRCFLCGSEFVRNASLATADSGDRFAADPARGRLWVICAACGAWNLVPIDARWEALEELEKVATDQGRVIVKTDNVALVECDNLTIVRIGTTQRKEEAWWRFLREAERRSANARKVVNRGKWKDALWNTVLIGLPLPGTTPAQKWIERARDRYFGENLWVGNSSCSNCHGAHEEIGFSDSVVLACSSGGLEIHARCWKCAERNHNGYFRVSGLPGTRAAQRYLAYHNFSGAGLSELEIAVSYLDHASSATEYVERLSADGVELAALRKPDLLALEMAISETRERDLLSLEARELEARWKSEEELALIIDRELSPP